MDESVAAGALGFGFGFGFERVASPDGAAAVAVPVLAASLPVSLAASLPAGGLAAAVFFFASPAACDPGAGGLVPV